MAKSAQFPLHVWLPDAMEGPTPVSALIHAATMVAAGVYLLARGYILFSSSTQAIYLIALIGGISAFLAATIGLVQRDIKRILAFSTMSQLGYMVMAIGVGSLTAGMFHLTTHAFFKALLFLGAGSVIHAVHTQDILKWVAFTKDENNHLDLHCGRSGPCRHFPLAGFEQDEILLAALENGYGTFPFGISSSVLTAFYMFRLFCGFRQRRKESRHVQGPWTMTIPLFILAVFPWQAV